MTTFVCTGNTGKIQEYFAYLGGKKAANLVGIDDMEESSGLLFVEPEENYNFFLGNGFLKLASSLRFVADTIARGEDSDPEIVERIIVDDSGLCVPALNFEPGVHSAYYGGQPRGADRNRLRLREEIARIHGKNLAEEPQIDVRVPGFFVCFILSAKVSKEMLREVLSPSFRIRDFRSAPLEAIEKDVINRVTQDIAEGKNAGGSFHSSVKWSELYVGLPVQGSFAIDFGYCLGEVSTQEQALIPGAGHGYDNMYYAKQHPQLSFASIPMEQKNAESHRSLAMQSLQKHPV